MTAVVVRHNEQATAEIRTSLGTSTPDAATPPTA
jgi:hypothetical protein